MRHQTGLQAGQKSQQVAAFRKFDRRLLHSVMANEHRHTALLVVMAMQVDRLSHENVQSIVPVDAHIFLFLLFVASFALHQLVWRPSNLQIVRALVQTQVASEWFAIVAGLNDNVVLAIQKCGLAVLMETFHILFRTKRTVQTETLC